MQIPLYHGTNLVLRTEPQSLDTALLILTAATRRRDGEVWRLAGTDLERGFDNELTQRHLDGLNGLLSTLVPACLEFAETKPLAKAAP